MRKDRSGEMTLQQLALAAQQMPFGFAAVKAEDDGTLRILALNEQMCRLCGYDSVPELMQQTGGLYSNLVVEEDLAAVRGKVLQEVKNGAVTWGHNYFRLITRSGELRSVEDAGKLLVDPEYGRIYTLYITIFDEHHNQNIFDSLTGAYSRDFLLHWIASQREYNVEAYEGRELSVLYLNLSGFRAFNESFGYEAGDDLLQGFTRLVKEIFRTHRVARVYADQFDVFYDGGDVEERMTELHVRTMEMLEDFPMWAEAGLYRWTDPDVSVDEAVARASAALQTVRGERKRFLGVYTPELAEKLEKKIYVQTHIDEAIQKGWITLYLQPVVRTLTGKVCSFEALSRWQDPKYGMISPGFFVEALEERNLCYKLSAFVIDEVTRMISDYEKRTGTRSLPVSLNLSRKDFAMFDPFERIEAAVERNQIGRDQICVEITETTAMEDPERIREIISRFHNMKYSVWMDDFGASYSSLNALKDFDFDEIKMDMAFMKNLNEKGKRIVVNCTNMAKELGIHTLCEGVETADQVRFLRDMGCEKIQGFYYSRPRPVSELETVLEEKHLKKESHEEAMLFDLLSDIRFDPSQCWFFALHDGVRIRLLYVNPKLREEAELWGMKDVFREGIMDERGTAFSPRLCTAIDSAVESGKVVNLNYFQDGTYYAIQAKVAARFGQYTVVRTMVSDTTENSRQLIMQDANPFVQSVVHLCDAVYRIDPEDRNLEVVASDFVYEEPGRVVPFDLEYSSRFLQEEDRDRFREWVAPERIRSFFSETRRRGDASAFRIHGEGSSYHWERFVLIRIRGSRQLILCLVPASEEEVKIWENSLGGCEN